MHSFVVPKSRRPRFNLKLQINDLNNVPLVSGLAYVKWHIRDSPLAESRGRTSKIPIKEHRVSWGYIKELVVKMTVDRAGMLSPVYLDLEIIQEYSGRERIVLGTLELNLAEYVGRERENRRYLMQASKINSTVQIATELKQISGDTSFKVPDLRPAQVFSGIAGIAMGEQLISDTTEAASTPATTSPAYGTDMSNISAHSRERDRIQDIYRKSLAASWQLQTGELNAVDCIEDIFSGGSGWAGDRDQRQHANAESTQSATIADDHESSNVSADWRVANHRSSAQRFSSWPQASDSPWKRARSFHILERHPADVSPVNSSTASNSRSTSQLASKTISRGNLLTGRPSLTTRNVSIVESNTSATPENTHSERATSAAPSVAQGWHPMETAEEDLRENFISWSV
ncbi:hypothetical protein TWF696_003161 [Orbilia brochopaga]|uniref:C2 NT-type domain-containing protein n=1 Tax=Orbilia brochopaga TaxID=3140254 RepID=A0AAV9U068_9PEZI